MKATDLLKKQHKEVKELFKRLEKAPNEKTRAALFEELAANLTGHDAIERQVFYPACEAHMGITDELGEALVEHGFAEFGLYQADRAQGDDFKYKCTVLKEIVLHHIEEEEKEFFPKVEKALGKKELEDLTEKMELLFEEVKESDFRALLIKNLQQVVKGATKTSAGNSTPRNGKTGLTRRTPRRSASAA
jgi:hypothetical protein